MHAYLPENFTVALTVLGLNALIIILGHAVVIRFHPHRMRLALWVWTFVSVALALTLTHAEPVGFKMVAIIITLLSSLKLLMLYEYQRDTGKTLRGIHWLAFASMWLGMNPHKFSNRQSTPLANAFNYIRVGILHLLLGVIFILLARFGLHQGAPIIMMIPPMLIGMSLFLHFGLMKIAVGFWRGLGYQATPLFRLPLMAHTLGDFWGKRWNLGFMEMMTQAVVRPLRKRVGYTASTMICFILSGIFHDLAISLPVNTGYGLPTLYFTLHGLLVLAEHRLLYLKKLLGIKIIAHIWTLGWLLLPLPLLFHKPFLQAIVVPLMTYAE